MSEKKSIQISQKSLIQSTLGYLSIRARSRKELIDYAAQKTTDEEVISQAIKYLEQNHLIDDIAFAKAWTEFRLRQGKGDKVIAFELHQKGITQDIIQTQIEATSESLWEEAYQQVIKKYQDKWLCLKGYQQKSKIYQVFQSRGFSSSRIDAFLKRRVE